MDVEFKITEYEELLFPVVENAVHKLIASILLFESKVAYPSAYFLAVIAEEELAKLILMPIAKEIGKLNELLSNKKGGFFNHRVKQKIFSSYSFFERKWEQIEEKKQKCLYAGNVDNGRIGYCRISETECFDEIKNATWVYAHQNKIIEDEKGFTDSFKKSIRLMTNLLISCIKDKNPKLLRYMKGDLEKEATKLLEQDYKSRMEGKAREALFKNPYRMIEIIKYALGDNYKGFLDKIRNMSFFEMVQCLGKQIERDELENKEQQVCS